MADKSFEPYWMYMAELTFGKPTLAHVEIVQETARLIQPGKNTKLLIGYRYIQTRLKKEGLHLFPTMDEALEYLQGRLQEKLEQHEWHVQHTKEELADLALIRQAAAEGKDIEAYAEELTQAHRDTELRASGPIPAEPADNGQDESVEGHNPEVSNVEEGEL